MDVISLTIACTGEETEKKQPITCMHMHMQTQRTKYK